MKFTKRQTMSFFKSAIILIILLAGAICAHAEYVFLRDGSIHQGKIINDTAAVVTMQLKNGTVKAFTRNNIIRILYTDIYMGKHFIRLNTGEMLEAYQVDEDSETYTFRRELNKAEEFTVKRSNVLFMTRTNPTGLEARPNLSEIRLTWLAPFQTPRSYVVYIKERKEDQYKPAGKTTQRRFTAKGLATKKTYFFIVTAIGADGNESVPSNEIQIRTNLPPRVPASARYSIISKKKEGADIKLAWKPSSDPDGTITGYRVYQRKQYAIEKIEEIPGAEVIVPEVPIDRDNHFMIRAVDDDGAESESRTVSMLLRRISITAQLGCILPVGSFGNLMEPGAAVAVNAAISNFWINYLYVGLDIGYMRMNCKMDNSYALNMLPVAAAAAYQFEISPLFSLVPKLSIGMVWLNSQVVKPDLYTTFAEKKSDSIEPLIGVGLGAQFQVIEMFSAGLDASYALILEQKPKHYFTLMANFTLRFKI
ncbi:MAG TPA: hypothetical protein PLA65_05245 [Spirochaetota bacterium]|nr:hypothetical protein [Spirochaetota bacterium]HOD15411.1 hypothetical protein [Spirochaetota bacterium]HPG50253.1 hypothetical protein [Spirochaetota bacterium]HPN11443.1 hypothetical protein [Spirochaetota bacterium]